MKFLDIPITVSYSGLTTSVCSKPSGLTTSPLQYITNLLMPKLCNYSLYSSRSRFCGDCIPFSNFFDCIVYGTCSLTSLSRPIWCSDSSNTGVSRRMSSRWRWIPSATLPAARKPSPPNLPIISKTDHFNNSAVKSNLKWLVMSSTSPTAWTCYLYTFCWASLSGIKTEQEPRRFVGLKPPQVGGCPSPAPEDAVATYAILAPLLLKPARKHFWNRRYIFM